MTDQTNDKIKACIKIVISQTNYTEEEASVKLKEWDYNFIKVIKEYLNPKFQEKKKEKPLSLNQRVIGEIRKFKDKQCSDYQKEKDYQEDLKKQILSRNKYFETLKEHNENKDETLHKSNDEKIVIDL